jgi:hypothetical protein
MKPNIFMIDPALGPEDALTAYWHYLLSVVPGLGQSFVDEVCRSSGLAVSEFMGAIDHPYGNSDNRPDLLLQCRDWSLLFEHKYLSPVGRGQLDRYVALAQSRGWKLALMAAERIEVGDDVVKSPTFVKPSDPGRPNHFFWQDLHPLLANVDHHLASEFSEFLELNGLGRFSWAGIGNPFVDDGAAKSLVGLYDSLGDRFRRPGVQCRKSASSLIYQIRTPFPPVHLINVGPLQSVAQSVPSLRGAVMGVWVWVRRRSSGQRVLSTADTALQFGTSTISVKNYEHTSGLPYDRAVHSERSYYVPLDEILQDSISVSRQRLSQFVESAVDHLRQEVSTTVPNQALQPTSRRVHSSGPTRRARAARG